jgi:adenine-specific DNA-methyltransferase
MRRTPKGRLELTWMGKDMALIPAADGKYSYAWVDRGDPRAREVKSITPVAVVGQPDGPTGAGENLMIVGDSGDALRALGTVPEWAARYRGKVKLVYIDPPFNTSQTFQHYEDQLEHSVWLTMMRDRIREIKPLLASDASIWVHLDDAEVHRMRVLLDEEFGAQSFVAQVVWEKVYTPDNRSSISPAQDYILVYSPDPFAFKARRNLLPRTDSANSPYGNRDNDPRGMWRPSDFTVQAGHATPSQFYELRSPAGLVFTPPPGRAWVYTQARYEELLADNRVWFGRDGLGRPNVKRFLSEVRQGVTPDSWWPYQEVGHNQDAKKEILAMFPGQEPFDTPKPERLLQRIIHIATDPGDVVLDCFAGSGTTAAVAHKMGRRWVTVELLRSTVDTFTRPRLEKVIKGEDPGGITVTKERVAAASLPDGVTPADAQTFGAVLTKAAKSIDGLDEATIKALRAATRTKTQPTVTWRGGGGFTVAEIGPSMYEVDDDTGEVYLSPAATNGAWSKAVAGQMRFELTENHPVFCGRRGRERLAVIDGIVDQEVVRTVTASLGEAEGVVIVAKGFLPDAQTLLRELAPGAVVRKAPSELFPRRTVK